MTSSVPLHSYSAHVQADKIQAIVDAAGVKIEPYWAGLFARLAESTNIGDMISSLGSVGGGAAAAPAAPAEGGGGGDAGGMPFLNPFISILFVRLSLMRDLRVHSATSVFLLCACAR